MAEKREREEAEHQYNKERERRLAVQEAHDKARAQALKDMEHERGWPTGV